MSPCERPRRSRHRQPRTFSGTLRDPYRGVSDIWHAACRLFDSPFSPATTDAFHRHFYFSQFSTRIRPTSKTSLRCIRRFSHADSYERNEFIKRFRVDERRAFYVAVSTSKQGKSFLFRRSNHGFDKLQLADFCSWAQCDGFKTRESKKYTRWSKYDAQTSSTIVFVRLDNMIFCNCFTVLQKRSRLDVSLFSVRPAWNVITASDAFSERLRALQARG